MNFELVKQYLQFHDNYKLHDKTAEDRGVILIENVI